MSRFVRLPADSLRAFCRREQSCPGCSQRLSIAATPAVSPLPIQRVQEVAGSDVAGSGGGCPCRFLQDRQRFSGRLLVEGVPSDLIPDVIGSTAGSSLCDFALVSSGRPDPTAAGAGGSAIAELELSGLMVWVSPRSTPAQRATADKIRQVVLPGIGGTVVKLVARRAASCRRRRSGSTAALLQAVGQSPRDLGLVGGIDARMLSGAGLRYAPSQADFIDAVDFQFSLSALAPTRELGLPEFRQGLLLFKGVGGEIASGVATGLRSPSATV